VFDGAVVSSNSNSNVTSKQRALKKQSRSQKRTEPEKPRQKTAKKGRFLTNLVLTIKIKVIDYLSLFNAPAHHQKHNKKSTNGERRTRKKGFVFVVD
jgi:hypothetical protein